MFEASQSIASDTPFSVAAGDVDGDGDTDLVFADLNGVSVALAGPGGLVAPVLVYGAGAGIAVALGDLDGDGDLDIVAGLQNPDTVQILWGDGASGFATGPDFAVNATPGEAVLGDFNEDGDLDILSTVFAADELHLLLSDGAGGWTASILAVTTPGAPAVVDGDGDGHLDFILSNFGAGDLVLVTGDGTGSFGLGGFITFPESTGAIVADFNGDGDYDIAAPQSLLGVVTVMLSDGSGGNLPDVDYTVGTARIILRGAVDLNGDGKLDLVTANFDDDTLGVLFGDGLGGFASVQTVATSDQPFAYAAGDFDLDGRMDLAVVTAEGLTVLYNGPPSGPPPAPTAGGTGSDLAVLNGQGTSYSALDGDDEVYAMDGDDWVHGNAGNDYVNAGGGNDIAYGGKGNDEVVGEHGDDRLFGDAGHDKVQGGPGSDTCEGGAGDDIVRGGQGNDLVLGGDGADFVSGDRGNDTLTGGPGADLFHIFAGAGSDRVTDFNAAEGDRVWVAAGVTWTVSQSGDDTVVSLSDGTTLTLVGVTAASPPSGWIFEA